MVINSKQIPDKVINNLIEGIKQYRFNPLAKSSKRKSDSPLKARQ